LILLTVRIKEPATAIAFMATITIIARGLQVVGRPHVIPQVPGELSNPLSRQHLVVH